MTSWEHLNTQQVGQYGEYFVKMELTKAGVSVFGAEVDDRGIDFVARTAEGKHYDVQVKTVRNLNYVYCRKKVFKINPNMLLALVLLTDNEQPELYLIPSEAWLSPNAMFCDRDYLDLKSEPEWGLNLSVRNMPLLEAFTFQNSLAKIIGDENRAVEAVKGWETTTAVGVRDDAPLIYLIKVRSPNREFRYIGRASSRSRFRSAYHRNIKRVLAGQTKRPAIKRNGEPQSEGNIRYRQIHLVLAVASQEGWPIEHIAIENVEREDLRAREQELITEFSCNLNSGKTWAIEEFGHLKAELINETAV